MSNTSTGSVRATKKLIPELRFPEVENEAEWEEKALIKLADRVLLKNKDNKVNRVFTNSALHGIVDQQEYFDKDIANKSNLENYYVVEDGDYVYNPRISREAPVGPTSKNKTGHTGVMSPLYTVFRFKKRNNEFYEYYFKTIHWYDSIRKASNTGARFDRMSITDSVFMSIPILYPQPKEQQKIASCLSSLDELITAHNDKLNALKDHKKGLMQNLFPQDGQRFPNQRFSKFKNDGEWQFKYGNQLFESISNKNHNSDLPILAITQEHGAIPRELIDYTVIATKQSISGYKVVEIGDFIISLRSFQGGIEYSKYKGICSPAYIILRKKEKLNDSFFKYYFKSDLYIRFLNKNLEGLRDGKMISYTQFSEIPLPYPSIQEQQKIASCLSALDELIIAQAEKIEHLQLHKKGLMQGLFPKNES